MFSYIVSRLADLVEVERARAVQGLSGWRQAAPAADVKGRR